MNKKYRINWRKMSMTLIVAISLIIALVVFVFGGVEYEVVGYELYVVSSGDSLWAIAEEFKCPEMDTREFVYIIMESNNCSPELSVGDVLDIPIYEVAE